MRSRKFIFLIALFPLIAYASEPVLIKNSTDTFGHLLEKQLSLLDSEMDAKIRANQNQGMSVNARSADLPANAQPLLDAKQNYSAKEPVLEAIWGVVGQEVAELNYLGVPMPVSMQDPYISRIDGWKLENITPYSITLIKLSGKSVSQRKTITLDWRQSGSNSDTQSAATVSVQ